MGSFKRCLPALLLLALYLGGCSEMTDIDAPMAVEPFEEFDLVAEHTFSGQGLEAFGPPASNEEQRLLFLVVVPDIWSIAATATYSGTWDGSPVDLDLQRLSGAPETNFVTWLIEEEGNSPDDPEVLVYEGLACDLSGIEEPLPPDVRFAYFVSTTAIGPPTVIEDDDSGEVTVAVTSGAAAGSYTVGVLHGLFGDFDDSLDDVPTTITYCTLFPEVNSQDPSIVTTDISQLSSAVSLPIPTLSAWFLAALAGALVIAGMIVGRRRRGLG